jgi:hypothetical protein
MTPYCTGALLFVKWPGLRPKFVERAVGQACARFRITAKRSYAGDEPKPTEPIYETGLVLLRFFDRADGFVGNVSGPAFEAVVDAVLAGRT